MRLSKTLLCCVLFATASIQLVAAQPDERAAIEAATAQWIDAFNRKDVRALVALYAPDAVLFGTSSPVLRDSPQLVQEYFRDLPALGDALITLGERRLQVFGEIAVSTGFYTRSAPRADGTVERNPARFTFVYQKRGGRWLILNHHSSALPQSQP